MTTTDITWKWGTNTLVTFNPKTDMLNFGWFAGNQFTVTQDGANLVIAIPSNDQKYTLLNTSLADLTMADVKCLDPSAEAKWKALLNDAPAPGPAPDPVPPKPEPDPVPPGPAPDPDPVPPGPGPAPAGDRYYSPYIDMGLWVSRQFPTIAAQAGVNAITLGFMIGVGESIQWGGSGEKIEGFADTIKGAQANGLMVTIAFGGAAGPDPGYTYRDEAKLLADLQRVITANNCKRLDFDVEGGPSGDHEANRRRARVLKKLKAANPGLFVSFTIAVLQDGLTREGMDIIQSCKDEGFDLDVLNMMAMDYYTGERAMGQAAVKAANSCKHQLEVVGLTNTRIGITPMVGINDSKVEIFTLDNAKEVLTFATATAWVESLGIWSLGRDNGNEPRGEVRYDVSGLDVPLFGYSAIFKAFK